MTNGRNSRNRSWHEAVFTTRVRAWQHGMRFLVDINGVEVVLERDDERHIVSCAFIPRSTGSKVGALSDLDDIAVRIADVAADLAVLGDRLRDELGSPTFP